MTRSRFRLILAFALLPLLPACGDETTTDTAANSPLSGTGVVLGGNTLHFFSPTAPGTFTSSVAVSGLDSGYALATIDYRPATKQLYGIATNGANGRLYAINPDGTAAAVSGADFSTTLAGTRFASDFNPVVDLIRMVSDTGMNLRIDPDTGALVQNDTALNPGTPAVYAIAYTNNSAGATLTTLYGIDGVAGTLVLIGGINGTPSPNGGALTTVGALGVVPDVADIGFDITPAGVAYAAFQVVGGVPSLYTINLSTGAATLVGTLGPGTVAVRGLAIAS